MSFAWAVYRAAAPVLGAMAPAAGAFAPPRERAIWGERLGRVAADGGCDAWIHAASLGETTAALALARELVHVAPQATLRHSATTRTGRARLAESGARATLAPLDAPQLVRRFFDQARPQRLFLLETELWPHWLLEARRRDLPVAVVSARLSRRSLERYRSLGTPFRRLVGGLAGVLAQSEEDAARWRKLGAPPERLAVTGNLKSDGLPRAAADRGAARRRLGLDPGRSVLVLGCLRPGEVAPLARAWRGLPEALRDDWQVVAVPRHERAARELAEEAADAGQVVSRGATGTGGEWRWDPRPGVLSGYYAVADVAFVGGSLRPYGGHNPLEPAACGAAVLMGPWHAAQADAVRGLEARGAIDVVAGPAELGESLRLLLGDRETRARRAAAALTVVAARRGAARRAVEVCAAWQVWPLS